MLMRMIKLRQSRAETVLATIIAAGLMLMGCAPLSEQPEPSVPGASASPSQSTASAMPTSAPPSAIATAASCKPQEPVPSAAEDEELPPAGLLGSPGGGWGPGELNAFEWREGDVISEGVGAPAIVRPEVTYTSAPAPDMLLVTATRGANIRGWDIHLWPWSWYDLEALPPGEQATRYQEAAEDSDAAVRALCMPAPAPGDYFVSVEFDFGEGNHAAYRWHLVIPGD